MLRNGVLLCFSDPCTSCQVELFHIPSQALQSIEPDHIMELRKNVNTVNPKMADLHAENSGLFCLLYLILVVDF